MKRLTILVGLAVILNLSLISPALAATPANDLYAGRTVIGSLPFSDSLDTTEATTDADDVEDEPSHLWTAPATDASVWYELTPAADGAVVVDVSSVDVQRRRHRRDWQPWQLFVRHLRAERRDL